MSQYVQKPNKVGLGLTLKSYTFKNHPTLGLPQPDSALSVFCEPFSCWL